MIKPLRARLEAELHIPGHVWAELERSAVRQVEAGAQDYRWLKAEARRLMSSRKPIAPKSPVDERDVIVSRILHARASRDPQVTSFRKDVLSNDLVRPAQVPSELGRLTKRRRQRLDRLAESLADRYGWTRGEAALFVLSGGVILLRSLLVGDVTPDTQRTGYLVLTVNPLLSPRELAQAYTAQRRRIFGERMRRLRRQKPKALNLALFMAEQSREGTWARRMDAWNHHAFRTWRYRAVSNFYRDAVDAERRLDEQLGAYRQEQTGGTKK